MLFIIRSFTGRILKSTRLLAVLIGLVAIPLGATLASTAQDQLPVLGDSTSAIVSPEKEYKIGRAWLRELRRQAPIISDPLLTDYLEHLLYRLASNSQIPSPDLEMVIINSPQINAFAVPGGVIGLNAGLLLNAENQDQLSAVIAHELAHLSQRHFARGLAQSKRAKWTNLAALMASAIVAVAAGGDAGMAALATTQASAIDQRLRFSRYNEQEADHMGMQTLAKSNMDPNAMADFFEQLMKNIRYSGKPPEFLLTHPVTESRISDARNRAMQYPSRPPQASLEFDLMKIRTIVWFTTSKGAIIKELEANLKEARSSNQSVIRYGLALAYLKSNRFKDALAQIDQVIEDNPYRITYQATKAEILIAAAEYEQATVMLEKALDITPLNFPLSIYYAEALLRLNHPAKAKKVLEEQLTLNRDKPYIWYLLSETSGRAGDILNVHRARAEYLYLNGRVDQATQQLEYALPLAKDQFQINAKITARIKEMQQSQNDLKL